MATIIFCVLSIVAFVLYLMWLLATVMNQEEKIIFLEDDIRRLKNKIEGLERELQRSKDKICINDLIEDLNYIRRIK